MLFYLEIMRIGQLKKVLKVVKKGVEQDLPRHNLVKYMLQSNALLEFGDRLTSWASLLTSTSLRSIDTDMLLPLGSFLPEPFTFIPGCTHLCHTRRFCLDLHQSNLGNPFIVTCLLHFCSCSSIKWLGHCSSAQPSFSCVWWHARGVWGWLLFLTR